VVSRTPSRFLISNRLRDRLRHSSLARIAEVQIETQVLEAAAEDVTAAEVPQAAVRVATEGCEELGVGDAHLGCYSGAWHGRAPPPGSE
jgi:hypothetical protein